MRLNYFRENEKEPFNHRWISRTACSFVGYLVGDGPDVVRALHPHEGEADLHVIFKFLDFDMALTVAIQKFQGCHDVTVCGPDAFVNEH